MIYMILCMMYDYSRVFVFCVVAIVLCHRREKSCVNTAVNTVFVVCTFIHKYIDYLPLLPLVRLRFIITNYILTKS
jgi:hypothetical protein